MPDPLETVTIQPSGALAGVRTIEAIRILRMDCGIPLKEAKHRVEAMVEHGVAELALGHLLHALDDPAAAEMATGAWGRLEEMGVSLRVGGLPIPEFIERRRSDPPSPIG